MRPLATALDIFQAEKNMFLSYLLPALAALRKILMLLPKLAYCEPLKSAIVNGIQRRIATCMDDKILVTSAITLPRFKLHWVAEAQRGYSLTGSRRSSHK